MTSFLALNGAAVLVALLVAVAVGLGARLPRLLLATLCGYLVVVHTLVLAAGLAGHLTVGGLAAAAALALAGAIAVVQRARRDSAEPENGAGGHATVAVFGVLSASLAGIVWLWPHVFDATRLWIWDDYTYHMVYPTLWLREHAIAAPTPAHVFTMQAWYPLSASVVATWLMAPFAGARADALASVSFTGVLYAGIVACGAAEMLERLGRGWTAWAIAVLPFATSGRIAIMASTFSDADLALAAALFAAFAFALPRGGSERPDEITVDTGYAAALTGFALGVKVSAAIPAVIVAAMLVLRARGSIPVSRARALTPVRLAVMFAVAWMTMAGYWYVRNLVHTGNPVYPARFLLWPGATFPETTLLEYSRTYGVKRALTDALAVYMNWPAVHATLAVIGLVGLAAWLPVRARAMTRAERYFAAGGLALAVAVLLALPATPYSAGNAMTFRSGFVHWDSMRYVGLLLLLGWTALGVLLDGSAGAARWPTIAAAAVTIAALLWSGSVWLDSPLTLVALAVCAKIIASLPVVAAREKPVMRGLVPGTRHVVVVGGAALAIAGIVLVSHSAKAAATADAFQREPLFGAAAGVLDAQPAGTRVAVFGDQWIYPAFGARHQLRPVRLDRDGRIATTPVGDAMEPGELTVDAATFRANLTTSDVGLVVVLRLPHPGRPADRPTQEAALATMPGTRLLHRDTAVTIWSVGDRGAANESRATR